MCCHYLTHHHYPDHHHHCIHSNGNGNGDDLMSKLDVILTVCIEYHSHFDIVGRINPANGLLPYLIYEFQVKIIECCDKI